MFTGIITQQALVKNRVESENNLRFSFETIVGYLDSCRIGDSIAVSGVCLTIVELNDAGFSADVSLETLNRTTMGQWQEGHVVNLELALKAADRLGGHLVSGHIDACATLVSDTVQAGSSRMEFEYPLELARYVAEKGSVCIDGVSLTVNAVSGEGSGKGDDRNWFCVNLIPHTLEKTSLGDLQAGARVNLEIDMIARYLERLVPENNK